jgi:DNA mismatch repair protein MutS2
MNYFKQSQILLDFDQLLVELDKQFISEYGREVFRAKVENMRLKKSEIQMEYNFISEYIFLKNQSTDFSIHSISCFDFQLEKMHIENYFIDQDTLVLLKSMIENLRDIKDYFKSTTLTDDYKSLIEWTAKLFYDTAILREIDKIIDAKGEIRTNASIEYKKIVEKKMTIFSSIDKAFVGALNQARNNGYLNEITESIRQGRRVLAVNAMHKRAIKGMIIDESETGNIVFIEPSETIFLNNEASEINREEQREIKRLLIELTKFLSRYTKLISQYQSYMAHWDEIQAKARFMSQIEGCIPTISSSLKLENAFHPLLKIKSKKDKSILVPFSIHLSDIEKLMMISGPNAGGKSVTLKTIGLLGLMVQHGIPVSAQGDTHIPLYDMILGDLGDLQSINNELSTYSSKLALWKFMMKNSNQNSLLLFDELGDGTDPSFGAAMAQVVLEKSLENQSTIVATTHYSELKKFGENRLDTIHGNMVFDEVNLEPLYELSIGLPGSSYTFHIARKMGLNHELIKRAETLSVKEHIEYDKQLFKIEKKEKELIIQKQELDRNEKDVKKQMKDWNRLHLDLDLTRKKIKYEKMLVMQEQVLEKERELKQFKEELKKKRKEEELIVEQKRLADEIKENQAKSNELFKQIHRVDPNQVIKIGDRVQYVQTQAIGIVDKLSKHKVTVIFDNIKSTISSTDLIVLPPDLDKKNTNTRKIFHSEKVLIRELDLRGKYVYEAIPEVEDFINKALMNNFHEIKIIHGVGKLRTEVLRLLKTFKSIDRVSTGSPDSGGEGASFVYF